MQKYDLVKVIGTNKHCQDFFGALGIITKIHDDKVVEDIGPLYELLYVGRHHNRLSKKEGIPLFKADELEGI